MGRHTQQSLLLYNLQLQLALRTFAFLFIDWWWVHVQRWKSACGYFCSISVGSPHMSGIGFRDQLASFSARPPLIAHP